VSPFRSPLHASLTDALLRYEESLFKCEDDRYELDMVIECNASTLRTLQPLLDRINKLPAHERSKFRMPKTLKTIHAHAIELVYADHGADVVDYIHRAPATALPVVIPRLQVGAVNMRAR
jgi:paired amphipathic helix protein Sin3a